MLKTNWHTHTARCGHAIGTDEEYVQAAVKAGFRTLGFSDHAAYRDPFPTERMELRQVPEYMASIRALKEKYRDQIDLYLGMEVECYPDQWDTLAGYRKEMDYCILGQHYVSYDTESSYDLVRPEQLERYTDRIEYAAEHGLCDCICHPDVCMWSYPAIDDTVHHIAKRLAEISVKYDIPLELNCGSGVRMGLKEYQDGKRYPYPVRTFFETFAEYHCPVIIGLDIHDPKLFLTEEYLNRALTVTAGLDMNFLMDYDLPAAAAKRKQRFF